MDTRTMESPDRIAERSQRTYARLAGLTYLVVIVFDIAGVAIVSGVHGSGGFLDASRRIAVWEPLYRIALLFGIAGSLATILLAVGLYVTLKPVDVNLALTALLFRLVETAGIGTAGFGTLQIYLAANHANAFGANQLSALAALSSGGEGTYINAIFFCAGSAIFFYLFLRSAYIPRIIAAWGLLASALYMLAFIGSLIVPRSSGTFLVVGSIPIFVVEVSTGLWLLINGISILGVGAPVRSRGRQSMTLELPAQRVEVSFVGAPPAQQVKRRQCFGQPLKCSMPSDLVTRLRILNRGRRSLPMSRAPPFG